MALIGRADPLDNIEHIVACVRQAGDSSSRRFLIHEYLRGELDYSKEPGRGIGHRRGLLCTRLREEELWP